MGDTAQETRVSERVREIEVEAEAARMSVPELLVQKLDHSARMCGYAETFSEMDALRAERDGDCEYGCIENRDNLIRYIATLERQRDVLLEAAKKVRCHAQSGTQFHRWVDTAIAQVEEAS